MRRITDSEARSHGSNPSLSPCQLCDLQQVSYPLWQEFHYLQSMDNGDGNYHKLL